jgi:hypothetical protein
MNEPDNDLGEDSVAVYGFSFPPQRLSPAKIHNTSNDLLGIEMRPGWHHIGDVQSVNSPSHCQHDIFRAARLTHPCWDLILHHASLY